MASRSLEPVTNISSNFGEYLTSAYEVLKLVLANLNQYDLINASLVCKSWQNVVKVIMNERIEPFGLIYLKRNSNQCLSKYNFNNHQLHLFFTKEQPIKVLKKMKSHDQYCSLFHDSEKTFIFQAYDFDYDLKDFNQVNKKDILLVGISLPYIPGVKVTTFSIQSINDIDKFIKDNYQTNILKCLYIYSDKRMPDIFRTFIFKLIQGQAKFAFGGGVVKRMNKEENPLGVSVCISFSIPKILENDIEFEAFSLVLLDSCNTKDQIESKLLKFKNDINLRQYQIVLKCTCEGRKIKFEKDIFSKIFPDANLVGFFGSCEFGFDCDLNLNKNENTFLHSFSSSYVILTWGSIIKQKYDKS